MCLFAAIIQLKVSRVPSLLLLSILYLNKHCPGPGPASPGQHSHHTPPGWTNLLGKLRDNSYNLPKKDN